MIQKYGLSLALIILLLGCTPTAYENYEESEVVARQLTSTPIPATATAEPSPTVIAITQETPTVEKVRNVLAREDDGTPRPTITRRPPTITPTPKLTDEDISATVTAIQPPREYDSYVSPDGRKRIEIIQYDCTKISLDERDEDGAQFGVEQFNLIDLNGDSTKRIDEHLDFCTMPGGGFQGLFWSENSRYFYYTDVRVGAPDGGAYGWSRPISVYDSVKHVSTRLGSGELSHDGTKLAFWEGQWPSMEERNPTPMLIIWDVNEGHELSRLPIMPFMDDLNIKRKNVFEGYMAWSPDENALAYIVMDDSWGSVNHIRRTVVVRVDLDTMAQEAILETEAPLLQWIEWDDSEQLTLFVDPRENEWTYDLEAKSLTENQPAHYDLFDRVLGRPVTTITEQETERYSLDLTVYTFETAELAAEMAAAIQPNGTRVEYTALDGTIAQEQIVPDVGERAYWWHVDDALYLFMGWRNELENIERISLELGARPLNRSTDNRFHVRVANGQKDHLLDSVQYDQVIERMGVFLGVETVMYDDRNLPFGGVSRYLSRDRATDFYMWEVTIDGQINSVHIEETIDEELRPGYYTIVLSVRNNGTIDYDLVLDGRSY